MTDFLLTEDEVAQIIDDNGWLFHGRGNEVFGVLTNTTNQINALIKQKITATETPA